MSTGELVEQALVNEGEEFYDLARIGFRVIHREAESVAVLINSANSIFVYVDCPSPGWDRVGTFMKTRKKDVRGLMNNTVPVDGGWAEIYHAACHDNYSYLFINFIDGI